MANIDPAPSWADIRQLETTDRNLAGPGGVLNTQPNSIAARLNLLRDNATALNNTVAGVSSRQDAADSAIASLESQVIDAPGTLSDLDHGSPISVTGDQFPDVISIDNSRGPVLALNESITDLAQRDEWLKNSVVEFGEDGGSGLVGFINGQLNSVPRSVQEKLRDHVSVKDFGAKSDGLSDDTLKIQAALNSSPGQIDLPPGIYKMTGPITIKAGRSGLRGYGATLDFSGLTSGFAITISPGPTDHHNHFPPLDGVRIIGPSSEQSTADGIFIGNDSTEGGNTAFAPITNVMVQGFRDNITFGGNTWLNSLNNCRISKAWRYGINALTVPNAGEQINMHGGAIYDCSNTSGTAVALRVPNTSNADFNLFGVSFDYNDTDGLVESGIVSMFGCFFENVGPAPKFRVTSYDGREPASLVVEGGVFKKTMPFRPEMAGGRPSMIDVSHGSSRVIVRDIQWNRYGMPNTELVRVLSGVPQVIVSGTDPVALTRGDAPFVSRSNNLVINGRVNENISRWTFVDSGTGASVVSSWDADGPSEGSGCIKMVGTVNTRSKQVWQRVRCSPGRKMLIRAWVKAELVTNGRIILALGPEAFDQSQGQGTVELHYVAMSAPAGQVSLDANGNTVSDDGGWVLLSSVWTPPQGVCIARIGGTFENFVGTGKISKIYVWNL